VETPGGFVSGSVVSAEVQDRFDFEWIDDPSPFDTLGGPDFLTTPSRNPTARGRFRPFGPPHQRLELNLRLDENPLVSPDDPVRGAAARRVLAKIEQLETERWSREMALAAAGGRRAALWSEDATVANWVTGGTATDGVLYNSYTTAAATFTGGETSTNSPGVTLAGIQEAMVQWRSLAATGPTNTAPGTRVWYGSGGTMYAVEADSCSWNLAATGASSMRVMTPYMQAEWKVAPFDGVAAPRKPEDRLREMIRMRMAPSAGRAREPYRNPVRPGLQPTEDFRELRARETLAKVIGEDKFRRFVRDGFVTCRAKSGRTYQIFPGSSFTRVYYEGKEEDRLCVVLEGNFPPTDSLIVRYLMLLNEESRFRNLAVNQGRGTRPVERPRDERSLSDVFGQYKRDYESFADRRKHARSKTIAQFRFADAASVESPPAPVAAAG
jgi:hypothetical protein